MFCIDYFIHLLFVRLRFVTTALALFMAVMPLKAEVNVDDVVETLADAGFVNVKSAQTEDLTVFLIENDTYKLQASGIAAAVKIIEDSGLTQDKLVKVIVSKYQIPEVTLTYDSSTENWQTTYRLDESWELVKDKPKIASSFGNVDFVLYPQFYMMNLIVTQVYQMLFQINPSVECSLWPGGKLAAQVNIPIYNDGYGDTYGSLRPGFITASQMFRLPQCVFGKFTLGYFNNRVGLDLKMNHPLKNEHFNIVFGTQALWNAHFDGFTHLSIDPAVDFSAMLGAEYYWARWNTKFSLQVRGLTSHGYDTVTGNLYREAEGWFKAEAIRYFRHVGVGLFAMKGMSKAALFNGGFQFVVSFPPYKYHRQGHSPRLTTGHLGMSYNANNERKYYKETRTEASDNFFNANEFNPYYIESEIKKLNK